MTYLIPYIRRIILVFSLLLSIFIYKYMATTVNVVDLQYIKLSEVFALISVVFLYISLLISPFYQSFPTFPLRVLAVKARRALGISAFFFGLLHASLSFFKLLGGFSGLKFLTGKYLLGVILGAIVLVILTTLAVTSFDYFVKKMGKWWKIVHRLVYIAGFLVIVHALLMGAHFVDLSGKIPQVFGYALAILFILEALRIDKYLLGKFANLPTFGFIFFIFSFSFVLIFGRVLVGSSGSLLSPFNLHSEHTKQAQQVQLEKQSGVRYSVSFLPSKIVGTENQETKLQFVVYNSDTGQKVTDFQTFYDKKIHLVITDNSLNYFNHIHPTLEDGIFTISTKFPKSDLYHLYLNFQPSPENEKTITILEQQFAFNYQVGVLKPSFTDHTHDLKFFKTIKNYAITLQAEYKFSSSDMSVGQQPLVFGVENTQTHEPVKTLKPYLGSFGHLVMINQATFEYVHVHPTEIADTKESSGPGVTFLPLGLYGKIKPGIYRLFLQINPNNELVVADFTILIE